MNHPRFSSFFLNNAHKKIFHQSQPTIVETLYSSKSKRLSISPAHIHKKDLFKKVNHHLQKFYQSLFVIQEQEILNFHIKSGYKEKTVQLPTEAKGKTLEDCNINKTKKDHVISKNVHESISASPFSCETCQDGKSEALNSMNGTDNEHGPHDDELRGMRKCVSLGTGLAEYKDMTSVKGSSPSHGNHSGDEYPHISSNYANHASDLSHGYLQRSDEDVGHNSESRLSGAFSGGSSSHKRCIPRAFAKSNSLPYMHMAHTNVAQQSQSSEDLKALDSTWHNKSVDNDAVGTCLEHKSENDNSAGDETYDYVGMAKDWIVPVMDEQGKGKSVQELPTEDFKIRRIEKWVTDLQHSSSFEETNMLTDLDDHEQTILDPVEPSISDDKSILGIDAAKRYISSLNAAATTAQLANYGLVVIPFLSAFSSLRALNLSGNSIVKITLGALPRGLHILNLSKNNISTIEGLRELTRLRVLDLSYNHILRIGRGLASCSSLKELYLAGNKISEVDGLHRLLKLNVLDLRFNKVSTTKHLGQLAANSNSLQAISLEGNPAQKNIGDEHLKKFIIGLIPHIAYINRQSIKSIGIKDSADRISRADRATRVGRKSQGVGGRRGHVRLPPSGVKTTGDAHRFHEVSSQHVSCRPDLAMRRIHSEGLLRAV